MLNYTCVKQKNDKKKVDKVNALEANECFIENFLNYIKQVKQQRTIDVWSELVAIRQNELYGTNIEDAPSSKQWLKIRDMHRAFSHGFCYGFNHDWEEDIQKGIHTSKDANKLIKKHKKAYSTLLAERKEDKNFYRLRTMANICNYDYQQVYDYFVDEFGDAETMRYINKCKNLIVGGFSTFYDNAIVHNICELTDEGAITTWFYTNPNYNRPLKNDRNCHVFVLKNSPVVSHKKWFATVPALNTEYR